MSRVGLIGSNSVEFIDKLLSIWNNNDSAVLIDYDTPAKAAADILSEVGADFCYVEDTIKDKYGVIIVLNKGIYKHTISSCQTVGSCCGDALSSSELHLFRREKSIKTTMYYMTLSRN